MSKQENKDSDTDNIMVATRRKGREVVKRKGA